MVGLVMGRESDFKELCSLRRRARYTCMQNDWTIYSTSRHINNLLLLSCFWHLFFFLEFYTHVVLSGYGCIGRKKNQLLF